MADYSIQFCRDKPVDSAFICQLFDFLQSRGVKYNEYQDMGRYAILVPGGDRDAVATEIKVTGSKGTMAEIVDVYTGCDLETACFRIDLEYLCEVYFRFAVLVIPVEGKCLLIFETGSAHIKDEKRFLAFVRLCKDTFVRFCFVYGDLRKAGDFIPVEERDLVLVPAGIVSFYSGRLAKRIGRKGLLSMPALMTEQLDNGGVMVLLGIGSRPQNGDQS